jgi:hypothetical protein
MDMTFKRELWIFDNIGKRKYDINAPLVKRILELMEDLYPEWIIDFMREEDMEWSDIIFIAVIDNELHNLKQMKPEEGITFMKSLLRDIKIQKIIE